MDYQNELDSLLNAHLTAGDDEEDSFFVSGEDGEESLLEGIMGARDEASIVSRLASTRVSPTARLAPASRARITALTQGARLVRRIAEVNNARQALRPNSYCPITGTPLLPGGAQTIVVQPGGGNGTWKFLGLYVPDYLHDAFNIVSLQIAGQEVIYGTATGQPIGAPVTGVSVGVFNSRSPNVFNLTPWMGQTFTNTQAIVLRVVNNLTVGDTFGGLAVGVADTLTLTGAVLTQVDPCDVGLPGVDRKLSRRQVSGAMRNAFSFLR